MPAAPGLEAIEPFLREIMDAVEPRERKNLVDKLMRFARRANAQRIAANATPEGGKMAARKTGRAKRGKMFRRIGKASSLKIRTTPDMGELRFSNPLVESTAAVHHHGLEGFVGKTPSGRVIRTKYQARELLGFGKEQELFVDEVLKHLAGD
ncbi:phage virion morphogenesis protein [Novosphingobium aquae]|uniref:Phage virion morphogenesis protein n=1 Tax=Novosphingobium aquae TaxID=3133435 RepID=A0ABU8S556_9SPHN